MYFKFNSTISQTYSIGTNNIQDNAGSEKPSSMNMLSNRLNFQYFSLLFAF